jgi:hypothetical protein
MTDIFEMLNIAKQQKKIGKYTHIALGKNMLPKNFKQGFELLKYELWATRK